MKLESRGRFVKLDERFLDFATKKRVWEDVILLYYISDT